MRPRTPTPRRTKSTHFRRRLARFAPLLALVLIAGCSDLTGDLGGDLVTGLTIEDRDTGATLVTVTSSNNVSGSLNLARNAQRSLAIVLRGANGNVILPGISENVRITIINPNVASWTDTGGGAGTLRGNTTGT
ncbi:MAG TPA: hypothetical protein VGX50_06765, partial [Longimicrobium sp.]|nr:hypothetical protein [Longimicrobium sp.]